MRVDSQGGFRYRGKVKGKLELLVLTTSMNDPDWPDALDPETGIFTYFGDNKKPGRDIHDTGRDGNLILKTIFEDGRAGAEAPKKSPSRLFVHFRISAKHAHDASDRSQALNWCGRGDSNPRPPAYEADALPLSYAGMAEIGCELAPVLTATTRIGKQPAFAKASAGKGAGGLRPDAARVDDRRPSCIERLAARDPPGSKTSETAKRRRPPWRSCGHRQPQPSKRFFVNPSKRTM